MDPEMDDMEGVSSVQLSSCCLVFTFLIEVVLSLVGGGSEANQASYSQEDGVSASEEVSWSSMRWTNDLARSSNVL